MNKSRLLLVFVAAAAMSPAVWGEVATPESVSILRWYAINQTAAEFSVGQQPAGAAFDGTDMWIANSQSGNVTKLRAGDGAAPPSASCVLVNHIHLLQPWRTLS